MMDIYLSEMPNSYVCIIYQVSPKNATQFWPFRTFGPLSIFVFLENQLQLVLYLIGNFCINGNVLGKWWDFKILIFFEKNLYAYWWVRQLSFETPFRSYHEKRPSRYSCVSVYLTTAVTLCLTGVWFLKSRKSLSLNTVAIFRKC